MIYAKAPRMPFKAASRAGGWCAGLGFLATMSVLGLWLFGTAPELRRELILLCLGCVLICVVVIALQQRSSGGRRSFREIATAVCTQTAEEVHGSARELISLPRVLPSRRGQQLRSLAWGIGITTVLVGISALALGTPQRSELVEHIHSAGAEFGVARAEKVSDVRRKSSRGKDPYTATVVVQLPVKAGGEPVSVTVKATTNKLLHPGDPVEVLYAPAQPRLGAVAGDEYSLGWQVRGETMPAYMRWFFIAAWVLGCFVTVTWVSAKHGSRSYAHLGERDKSIRGRYTRVAGPGVQAGQESSGKAVYLEVRTDAGWVHFYTDLGKRGLPEVMVGEKLWLCWDAHRGVRASRISPSRTPAVLVFDTGLVVHGMMSVAQARSLNDSGVSVEKMAPAQSEYQSLRLFDFRSSWPLVIDSLILQICVVVIACAALLTFDVATGWRSAAGIIGFLGAISASGVYLSEGTSKKSSTV
ncbi:hypothetical protein [Streptomyces sp. NPDC006134]|uniref:hypothetical protein n=1 Tax=Streptomyces sp. NPDC006134 TaxID=3154467 RepID=UPI0033FBCF1E